MEAEQQTQNVPELDEKSYHWIWLKRPKFRARSAQFICSQIVARK